MLLNSVGRGEAADGRVPVVLLHGLFGSARNLSGVQASLAAAGMRTLALDLRNHGASPRGADTGYRALAADVAETLGQLGSLPCRLLGHSMGGKVAMRLALDRPEAVERLVVADIAPVAYAHANRRLAEAMLALPLRPGMTRAEAGAALAGSVTDPAVRAFLLLNLQLAAGEAPRWRIGLAELAGGMDAIQGWEAAPGTYDGPALFVAGGRSDYVPRAAEAAIRGLFPQAEIARLPAAGHWLHAEDPAGFLGAILPFLQDEARR